MESNSIRDKELYHLYSKNPELCTAKVSITDLVEVCEVPAVMFIFECALLIAYNQGGIDRINEEQKKHELSILNKV